MGSVVRAMQVLADPVTQVLEALAQIVPVSVSSALHQGKTQTMVSKACSASLRAHEPRRYVYY